VTGDLRTQLEQVLGPGYRVERELGGGGMSRVFVAEDLSLGRQVVIKVLAPELSSELSAERFRREIQLAARLQHPHIVPLFSAGHSGDLLYFTMPYVEGQSLRSKLVSGGELPVADAVRILRDVASALSYAHQHGVVHRDIKPENVLVSGVHAVVTDFGVAKALSDAAKGSTLTSAGLALGTPAYMAPEQAAADPATDHRADLYALGVLGYELLTGAPPFQGRGPAQLLAAHATESPEDISRRRATIPPPLASLLMRLLEKRPADRPQSAEDVLRELEAATTPSGLAPTFTVSAQPVSATKSGERESNRRILLGMAGALVLAIAGGGIWYARRATTQPLNANAMVIAPFRVAGADPSLRYLREGMVDLLAAKFTGEQGPSATDPRTVMSAWARKARSADNDLPEMDAVRLAEQLGAGRLLLGGIVGTSRHVVLTASVLQVPSGRIAGRATAEGPPDSLAALVDRLSVQLLAGEVAGGEQLTQLMSMPASAVRGYLGGRAAYRRGDYTTAIAQFVQALESDSTFAHAALGLAVAGNWGGSDEERDRGVRLAWRSRHRLSPKDRAYLELFAGPRYPLPGTPSEFIQAGRRAAEIASDNPEVWYEYGDALYHTGPTIGLDNSFRDAASAFRRALALDPTFAAPREHLIDIAARDGDTAAVRTLSRDYLARTDNFGTAPYTRWRIALALGDSQELQRIRAGFAQMPVTALTRIIGFGLMDGIAPKDVSLAAEQLRRSRGSVDADRGAFWSLHDLALNEGKPRLALTLANEFHPFPDALDSLTTIVFTGIFHGGDRGAAAAAAEGLRRLSIEKLPPLQQAVTACVLGFWSAHSGNATDARRFAQTAIRLRPKISGTPLIADVDACIIALGGWADFVERGPEAGPAMRKLDSLMHVGPVLGHEGGDSNSQAFNLILARWHESRGDQKSALAAVRRRVYHWGVRVGLWTFLRQEGRLAALAGDRAGAIRAYRHYLTFRSNPEPSIRPEVDSVRAELARLR